MCYNTLNCVAADQGNFFPYKRGWNCEVKNIREKDEYFRICIYGMRRSVL